MCRSEIDGPLRVEKLVLRHLFCNSCLGSLISFWNIYCLVNSAETETDTISTEKPIAQGYVALGWNSSVYSGHNIPGFIYCRVPLLKVNWSPSRREGSSK